MSFQHLTAAGLIALGALLSLPIFAMQAATGAEDDEATCLYERNRGAHHLCIRKTAFNTDLCRTIAHFAEKIMYRPPSSRG